MENEMRKKMFVKLYYSLLDWAWINDPNTLVVFIHLLLNANRKNQHYKKGVIRKGEVFATYDFLSAKSGLSKQQVRRAIKNLISTKDITHRIIDKTNVFTLTCWQDMENCFVDYNERENNDFSQMQHNKKNSETPIYNENNTDNSSTQHHQNIITTLPIYCKNEENEENVSVKECESEKTTHAHGKLRNVFISDSEYDSFRKEFPRIADKVIDELSEKIATGEKKYQSGHLGHLYVFARYFREEKKYHTEKGPAYDVDIAIRRSKNLDPTKTKRKQ